MEPMIFNLYSALCALFVYLYEQIKAVIAWTPINGNQLEPQGGPVDYGLNPKMSRKHSYLRKKKTQEKDKERHASYVECQLNRANERRRSEGRRNARLEQTTIVSEDFQPEGFYAEDSINCDISDLPDEVHWSRIRSSIAFASNSTTDTFDNLLSRYENQEDMPMDSLLAGATKLFGFLAGLFAAKDTKSIAGVMLASAAQHVTPQCIAYLRRYMVSEDVPQADFDLEDILKKFRDSIVEVRFLPMSKAILSTMMLMVISGMRPSSMVDSTSVGDIMKVWEEKVISSLSFKNLMDCISEIFEFSVQVVRSLKNGDTLKKLILPNTLHKQYATITPLMDHVLDGTLFSTYGMRNNDLLRAVKELIENMEYALEKSKSSQEKAMYVRYVVDLKHMAKKIADYITNHSFREEPFVISFFGNSSLGKSSLVQQALRTFESAMDIKLQEDEISYVKGIAKYDDGVTNNTKVVVVDDACNVKPSETERSSSILCKLIDIVNNTPAMTNQAELSMKGQHFWQPQLVIVTTNVANLNAPEISNKPISLVRRLNHARVEVLDKYRTQGGIALDVTKIEHVEASNGEILAPMHKLTWFEFMETGHHNQIKSVEGSMVTIPEFMTEFARRIRKKHEAQQKYLKVVENMKGCEYCKICHNPKAKGWCVHYNEFLDARQDEEPEPQSGGVISYLAVTGLNQFFYTIHNFIALSGIDTGMPQWEAFFGLISITLAGFFLCRDRIDFSAAHIQTLFIALILIIFSVFVFMALLWLDWRVCFVVWPIYLSALTLLSCVGISKAVARHVRDDIRRRICENVGAHPIMRGAKILSVIMVIVKMYNTFREWQEASSYAPEGNLSPTTKEDVESRNLETSDWLRPVIQKAEPFSRGMTSTLPQSLDRLQSNVWLYFVDANGYKSSGTVTFLSTGVCIMANHSFQKMSKVIDFDVTEILFVKDPEQIGQRFKTHLVNSTPILLDGSESDHVIVKLANAPTVPDITDLFTDHKNHKCSFTMIFRELNGKVVFSTGKYNDGVYQVQGFPRAWRGSRHAMNYTSRPGQCSSPMISTDKPHNIIGLHSAGNSNGCGVTFCVTHSELMSALDCLRQTSENFSGQGKDTYVYARQAPPDLAPYGEQKVSIGELAHERSAVNYCYMKDTPCTFFGDARETRITPRTEIRDSILKEPLREQGLKVDYGPPVFNTDRTHAKYLQIRQKTCSSIPPSLMKMAVDDYKSCIIPKIQQLDISGKGFIPLDQVLNGKPGSRFIGPINERTSSGFGLKGAKEKYLDITFEEESGRKIILPTPIIVERFHELHKRYSHGETCGSICRSALKDECVALNPETGKPLKENRLFMSSGMVDVFVQKSMCAEIAQVLQDIPLDSELASGINSTTNEWDQLARYLELDKEHSQGGMLEGDFSKYDVTLSGQLIRAAGYVILEVAKEIGYARDELEALESMLFEMSNNYRLFGGSLVGFDGYNPSGIFLTLIINGICNALLHRCAFYSDTGMFGRYTFDRFKGVSVYKKYVKSIFQGDDSTSRSLTNKFSMITVKKFCDRVGMTYTAGDKKSEIVPYVQDLKVKFCKRGFYLHPLAGGFVGNLDPESLVKSLCTYTNSVTTEVTVLTETLDAALRELARHPPDIFEKYRKLFDNAVSSIGIRHFVKYIDRSYEDWWSEMKPGYQGILPREAQWAPQIFSLDILMDE